MFVTTTTQKSYSESGLALMAHHQTSLFCLLILSYHVPDMELFGGEQIGSTVVIAGEENLPRDGLDEGDNPEKHINCGRGANYVRSY